MMGNNVVKFTRPTEAILVDAYKAWLTTRKAYKSGRCYRLRLPDLRSKVAPWTRVVNATFGTDFEACDRFHDAAHAWAESTGFPIPLY
jgi:hypothetical protein